MVSRLTLGVLAVLAMLEFTPPDIDDIPTSTTVTQDTRATVTPVTTTTVVSQETTQVPDHQQTITVPLVAHDSPCQEWVTLAVASGWPKDRDVIEPLVNIMWRESRCNHDSYNPTDPNGGSRGLLQINGFWCQPSQYWPDGYLQAHGILKTCDDLFDPAVNLRAGWALYNYSYNRHDGNGWHPWKV
jgi:hypothetical protein